MRLASLAIAIAIGGISISPAMAVQSQPAATTRTDGREVASAVRQLLNTYYVLPEMRPKFDAILSKGLADGRYNGLGSEQLVERLNADLHQVTPDKHLGVSYDPKRSRELAAAPPRSVAEDPPPTANDIRDAIEINHGIVELKTLPGNIRYMRYDGFVWVGPKTSEALDTAMRFLRDGNAAIIDLRGNGGGSPDAVRYLVSHFLPPNRELVTFYMGGNPGDRWSTLESLPTERMVGKPLYVLTSGATASAAEEFTGHVAGFKLGELIGETTAGAGFRNEFYALPHGMVISISIGRAVLASTGKDWEGVGIPPTTRIAPEAALDMAQAHALRRIAASSPVDAKAELEARATLFEARLNPIALPLPLSAYAGTYGERMVAVGDGRLAYQRTGGPKFNLVAVAPNRFVLEDDPQTYVRFTVAGDIVTGLELVRSDGSRVIAKRTN